MSRIFNHRSLAFFSVLLLLTSCASNKLSRYPAAGIDSWELAGKVGVKQAGKGQSAYIKWMNEGDDFEIIMNGVLGLGKVNIVSQGRQITISNRKETRTAANADALIYQVTGIALPVEGLKFWIRGLPSPREPVRKVERNSDGSITYLNQSGWDISYLRYGNYGAASLPEKIVALRDDLKLTLIIKSWNIYPNE